MQNDFFGFAADLSRTHARELVLSRPEPRFTPPQIQLDANRASAIADELLSEGRNLKRRPDPKGETL